MTASVIDLVSDISGISSSFSFSVVAVFIASVISFCEAVDWGVKSSFFVDLIAAAISCIFSMLFLMSSTSLFSSFSFASLFFLMLSLMSLLSSASLFMVFDSFSLSSSFLLDSLINSSIVNKSLSSGLFSVVFLNEIS